ncbi:PC4 domain-containing protein [Trichonephila clavipes]|nr:PC4 domain-containing protein [Trichonephila clavipes]
MKRATPLISSNPRAKRVCFDKDNGKVSSFKPEAVPENHFHLGVPNYAFVFDFACVARIHSRRYKLDATGSLLPTKDGIHVCNTFRMNYDESERNQGLWGLGPDPVLCATAKLFPAKGLFSQIFDSSFYAKRNGMECIKRYPKAEHVENCFNHVQACFSETSEERSGQTHIPFPKSEFDCIDAEIVLTTSMVELLCNHIQENISSLFICYGYLDRNENQLGHECMTYSNEQRISKYGDLAILNMDWDKLFTDFVNRNIQMVNYMSEIFINKLNMNVLIENAKQMYVATDSFSLC